MYKGWSISNGTRGGQKTVASRRIGARVNDSEARAAAREAFEVELLMQEEVAISVDDIDGMVSKFAVEHYAWLEELQGIRASVDALNVENVDAGKLDIMINIQLLQASIIGSSLNIQHH